VKCLICKKALTYRLTIKDLLWPDKISFPVICPQCQQGFAKIGAGRCPGCGRPQEAAMLCAECQAWQEKYGWHLKHRALYRYNDAMKAFMQQYKFNGDYMMRHVFHDEFVQAIQAAKADRVVPIPVTPTTMKTRGFNQVSGLLTGVKITECLQTRQKSKQAQSKKTRQERLATKQPFCLVDDYQLVDQTVLLVDDVYTTGRTLYHAAALIHKAGAREVISISLAR
jgi:competence protein ComFC